MFNWQYPGNKSKMISILVFIENMQNDLMKIITEYNIENKQAGAELCQAQEKLASIT